MKIVKYLYILVCLCALPLFGGLTSITDTLYNPDGTKFTGRAEVALKYPNYNTSGTTLTTFKKTFTIPEGVVSFSLEANTAISPSGTSYAVQFYGPKLNWSETWVVPESVSAVTIRDIRSTVVPSVSATFNYSQITGLTAGDILYGTSTGYAARLGKGTNDQILKIVNGVPTWSTADVGISAHATTHKNGGNDEVATAVPASNAIPKAGLGGTLDAAWIPTLNQNTTGTAAGLTSQYINWNATTGGSSIVNKPTLGDAALKNTGTTAGTVAAGDDSRFGVTAWSAITDKPSTFEPSIHASSHVSGAIDALSGNFGINITGNAATATTASAAPWSGITDKPSTFAPSAHASSHAQGQSDALSGTLAVSVTGNAATVSSISSHASTELSDTAGLVRGAASLSTVGAVPNVSAAGILGLSKLSCSVGVCTVYDDTATTGVTTFSVKGGAGQGSNNIVNVSRYDNTSLLSIRSDIGTYGTLTLGGSAILSQGAQIGSRDGLNTIGDHLVSGSTYTAVELVGDAGVIIKALRGVNGTGNADITLLPVGTGGVGVGTSPASRLFHVNLADSATNAVSYATRTTHTTSGTAAVGFGVGHEVELENASGNNKIASIVETSWADATEGSEDSIVKFYALINGVSTETLRLANGKAGFGAINPYSTLSVNGDITLQGSTGGKLQAYTNSAYKTMTFDALSYNWGVSGSFGKVAIDTSGNVGIGTTGPTNALDVVGSIGLKGATYKVTLSPSASQTVDYTLTWPTTQGANGQTLVNDGSGNLSWGSSSASVEWPLKVTRTSGTVLTVSSGNVRFGSTSYVITGGTVTITAGTGTAYVYIASDGTLTVAHNLTLTCSGCTAVTGTSFPTDSIPLYTWTATSAVWDMSGSTDYRALLSTKKITAGTGISVSEANGHATVAVDSSTDPYAKKMWIQAANCDGTTGSLNWDTLATLKPTAACTAGTTNTGLMRGLAQFSNSEISQMQTHFALPSTWGGAIDLKLKWQTSATSGSVVWQAATVCVADAEVNDAAWNTASTVTDAAKGTTLQTNDATITGATVTGCAAGEMMHLKIFRDPAHASDDLAATADLIGVEITLGIQ